ncbi:TonB-dependent receptor [Mucilaginibacter celer]|uniref:TonB-dependent siderophore receptor n=1 Tax=Mucilaginibacter celer TaxID=2305508 RepID=A0A494VUA7_9SPHI|nr:TonB-dependent receptor [Mucilaginibacter celer]AYL97671.1 TonB-dependent siderophore receptor [Mucilaginibacter celer]
MNQPLHTFHKLLSLLFLVVFTLFNIKSATGEVKPGTITGTITTADGQTVPGVTVGIKGDGINAGTVTNESGRFTFNKVKPGSYTIKVSFVGLASEEKTVEVAEGQRVVVNFMLRENANQLGEVLISGRKQKYKIDAPSASLRLNEPLLQVAQNVQVVTSKVLADQQVISMSDGLIRNVSGAVRLEHWGDLYTNITMRGSQIQAFRNGFNVVSSYWGPLTEDMSFVDHIEFVKGPAGFLLSNGDPSGLYNVVTKKPTGETKGEISFTTGSFNLNRATLDLDGKLSKDGKFLYRLDLSAQNKNSFRANEFNDRYVIAPVVSYQIDDKTKLTAEYVYQRAHMSDVGSYYVFSPKGYGVLPQNFTQLPAGLPPTNINDHSFTLNLTHQLSDNWKLTAQAARYNYSQLGTSMWADSVNTDGSYYRNAGIWEAKSTMSLAQVFLNGKVNTGSVVHNILAGVDLGDKKYVADYAQTASLDTGSRPFNPYQEGVPTLNNPSNGYPKFDRSLNLEARAAAGFGLINTRYSSIYLQDELGFFDNKVRLTLAGRYTYVQMADFNTPEQAKHFSPRIGLSVSIDDQTSVYGLRDQTFLPQAGKVSVGKLQPLTGTNTEFGIKRDWAGGKWNTTLSVYRILKNNELTADPNAAPNSGLSIIFGQKRSQGLEFDLRGEIAPGFNLTANYAYTDSKVSKVNPDLAASPTNTIKVGDVVPGYVKHVANAWLSYKLNSGTLKGTGVSLGGTYYGGRQTDTWSVGLEKLPNYFKMDGGLFWEGSKMRIAGNVFNVLNKYTYSGSYYSYLSAYYWQADAPRNYRLSIAYRF